MRWVRRILWVALFCLVLVGGWRFAAENGSPVTVSYLAGEVSASLWAVLLVCVAGGAAVMGLVSALVNARLRLAARRYRKVVHGLESEVHQLRNLPLASDGPAADPSAGVEPDAVPVARAAERGA